MDRLGQSAAGAAEDGPGQARSKEATAAPPRPRPAGRSEPAADASRCAAARSGTARGSRAPGAAAAGSRAAAATGPGTRRSRSPRRRAGRATTGSSGRSRSCCRGHGGQATRSWVDRQRVGPRHAVAWAAALLEPARVGRSEHDSTLHQARDGRDLDRRAALRAVAGDRAAGRRGDGRARPDPGGSGGPPAQRLSGERRSPDRSGADRGDRARDPPRRDRVPLPRRGRGRRRCPVSASRADLVGPARHRLRVAALRGVGPAAGRARRAARRPEAPRAGAPVDALHRALARHPRRADDFRCEARGVPCRVCARPPAPRAGARRGGDLRDLGRGRHVRPCRPRGRGRVAARSA